LNRFLVQIQRGLVPAPVQTPRGSVNCFHRVSQEPFEWVGGYFPGHILPLHPVDYDTLVTSQLASTQLTSGPSVVQIWSRSSSNLGDPKHCQSDVWLPHAGLAATCFAFTRNMVLRLFCSSCCIAIYKRCIAIYKRCIALYKRCIALYNFFCA